MVTQLGGTEQWVDNLEQGKALAASSQEATLRRQRGMCEPACAPALICVLNITV